MKKPLGNDWAVYGPEMAGNNEVGEEGDGMEIRDSAGREGWETTKSKVRKRGKKDDSGSGSGESGGEEGEGTASNREFKVLLKFKEGDGVGNLNPLSLTTSLKKEIGEIKLARVLRDGSVLVICTDVEQRSKALKTKKVFKQGVISSEVLSGKKWAKSDYRGARENQHGGIERKYKGRHCNASREISCNKRRKERK